MDTHIQTAVGIRWPVPVTRRSGVDEVSGKAIAPVLLVTADSYLASVPGLYTTARIYVELSSGYASMPAIDYFERGRVITRSTVAEEQNLFHFPLSLRNLAAMLHGPLDLDAETRTVAEELYQLYLVTIPATCKTALEARIATSFTNTDLPAQSRWTPEPHAVAPGQRRPACLMGVAASSRTEEVTEVVDVPLTDGELQPADKLRVRRGGRRPTRKEAVRRLVKHELKGLCPVPQNIFHKFARYLHGVKPYSQQLIGAWAICTGQRVPLWWQPRAGKTNTAIMAGKHLLATGAIDRMIVVAPLTNTHLPWARNMSHQGVVSAVLEGTPSEDEEMLRDPEVNCFILNYERVHDRWPMMLAAWDRDGLKRTLLVVDETSKVKNPASRRGQACVELACRCAYVTLLNGTPMGQGPQDLWNQMRMVDPNGIIWEPDFTSYKEAWLEQTTMTRYLVKEKRDGEFEDLLSTYSIRYTYPECDQANGKNKQNRYIKFRPTEDMYRATTQVLEGGFVTVVKDGQAYTEKMTSTIIRTMGFLREIAAGFSKFREDAGSPYIKVPFTLDPKLLWVKCKLESEPDVPLVIIREFKNQTFRLMEMLDEMGVKWSSSGPKPRLEHRPKFQSTLPVGLVRYLLQHAPALLSESLAQSLGAVTGTDDEAPCTLYESEALLFDEALIQWYIRHPWSVPRVTPDLELTDELRKLERHIPTLAALATGASGFEAEAETAKKLLLRSYARLGEIRAILATLAGMSRVRQEQVHTYLFTEVSETYEVTVELPAYHGAARTAQVDAFQSGETQVFIMHWSQSTGLDLHRLPAVLSRIGDFPDIVALVPPWSLNDYIQGCDRCIVQDPRTGRDVCTMIYHLLVKGTIEEDIAAALKDRQMVSDKLLGDLGREGFSSFANEMKSNMEAALGEAGDDFFDHEEMLARIMWGVHPQAKLTRRNLKEQARTKLKLGLKEFEKYLLTINQLQSAAWELLLGRCKEA